MKRCKNCGALDSHTSIYKETGLCMDCQSDWVLQQEEINEQNAIKKAKKEKDFYKFD